MRWEGFASVNQMAVGLSVYLWTRTVAGANGRERFGAGVTQIPFIGAIWSYPRVSKHMLAMDVLLMGTNQKSGIKSTSHQFFRLVVYHPSHDLRTGFSTIQTVVGNGNSEPSNNPLFSWNFLCSFSPFLPLSFEESFLVYHPRRTSSNSAWDGRMISDWQLSEPPISTVQIPDASWLLGGVNLHMRKTCSLPPGWPKMIRKSTGWCLQLLHTWRIIPLSSRWLITVVSPLNRVVPLPNGLSMTYKWGLLTTY